MSTHEKINEIIVWSLGLHQDRLKPETNLQDGLGADSLDAIELAMAFEDEWDIALTDEEIEHCKTVQNIYDLIDSKLGSAK